MESKVSPKYKTFVEERATAAQIQEVLDEVVQRATNDGYPPEMTHKDGLLDARTLVGLTDNETVIRHLIEAYESKYGIVCAMTHLMDLMTEYIMEPSNVRLS